MAKKMKLNLGETVVSRFYSNQDPAHRNGVMRWVNEGNPVAPELANQVLAQEGRLHNQAMQAIKKTGCLGMLVDGTVDKQDSVRFRARNILAGASCRPHAHVGEEAYALYAPPNFSSVLPTIVESRVATAKASLEVLDETTILKRFMKPDQTAKLEEVLRHPRAYTKRVQEGEQCPLNAFYFEDLPWVFRGLLPLQPWMWNFVSRVEKKIPNDAKYHFHWDNNTQYGRVFMFSGYSLIHRAGLPKMREAFKSLLKELSGMRTPATHFMRRFKYERK